MSLIYISLSLGFMSHVKKFEKKHYVACKKRKKLNSSVPSTKSLSRASLPFNSNFVPQQDSWACTSGWPVGGQRPVVSVETLMGGGL